MIYIKSNCPNPSKTHYLSVKIIPVDLIRHHHHPQQKDGPHNLKGERRPEIRADAQIGQPHRRLQTVNRLGVGSAPAIAVDGARGAVELDGGFDEAG